MAYPAHLLISYTPFNFLYPRMNLRWLTSFLLIALCSTASLLLISPLAGSHLFCINDIATFLAEEGHDITILSFQPETRIKFHQNVTFLVPENQVLIASHDECHKKIVIESSSYDSIWDVLEGCKPFWKYLTDLLGEYFSGKSMEDLLNQGNFSAIIIDEFVMAAVANVAKRANVPLISHNPMPYYMMPRDQQNLPLMLNSEPGAAIPDLSHKRRAPLSLLRRLTGLWKGAKAAIIFKTLLQTVDKKHQIGQQTNFMDQIELFLVNDHVAFSFPHLLPPNVIQIAGFNLGSTQPIPQEFTSFLDHNTHRPVIYLSFGSYATYSMISWLHQIIDGLEQLDVAVIFKTSASIELSNKFMMTEWVPQKDLLASGRVMLFISHCGNNGRIESIYYNVPLLCIPLFGDQYANAFRVQEKEFGRMLIKEDIIIDKKSVIAMVTSMIENISFYRNNMKDAADILKSEPASGKDKIKYYVELLIKRGNLSFLQNEVGKNQGMIEMYNLAGYWFYFLCSLVLALYLICYAIRSVMLFYLKDHNNRALENKTK